MKGLLLSLLLSASHSQVESTIPAHQTGWKLSGDLASVCVLTTYGDTNDAEGASVTVLCGDSPVTGSVSLRLPASTLANHRVTVQTELSSHPDQYASLWIKAIKANHSESYDTDNDERVFTNSPDAKRTLTSVIAEDAEFINVGLTVHGQGGVILRHLKITASSEGQISPAAQQVLDTALDSLRQSAARKGLEWARLVDSANRYASGAVDSADVYPVIRHVLQLLGDRQSMVLPPAAVATLNNHRSAPNAKVQIITLPDGAELVLMASQSVDQRIADRWP
jgi:hypothetical protein